MVQNKSLIFSKIPERTPVVGEHLKVEDRGFDLDTAPPKDGATVKILYSSFDPYLRGRMRAPEIESYMPPFTLGEPFVSHAVFKVLKSDNSKWSEGDLGMAAVAIAEYVVIPAEHLNAPSGVFGVNKIDNKYNLPLSLFIGAVGMPGMTAYTSFYDIGKPKKGDTIWISAASGAVGQLVGHLAKHEGLNVIGSVGNDEKLASIKELGFEGFNYKKEKPADAINRLAPKGLDIFYDNVGGEQLEVAIDAMKLHGRIVECGQISQYNLEEKDKYGVKNLELFFGKELTMRGFLVASYESKWFDELKDKVGGWIAKGEMKPRETFTDNLDDAGQGFVDMLTGKNFGKAVLRVGGDA